MLCSALQAAKRRSHGLTCARWTVCLLRPPTLTLTLTLTVTLTVTVTLTLNLNLTCARVQMAEKEGQPSDIRSPYTSASTAGMRAEPDGPLTAAPQPVPASTSNSGSEAADAGASSVAAVRGQNGRVTLLAPGGAAGSSAGSAAQGSASGASRTQRGDATAAPDPRPVAGLSGSLRT